MFGAADGQRDGAEVEHQQAEQQERVGARGIRPRHDDRQHHGDGDLIGGRARHRQPTDRPRVRAQVGRHGRPRST
ncbi:MAG TPA: hypothetical protein VIW24_17635 [Aldersonia sp.]